MILHAAWKPIDATEGDCIHDACNRKHQFESNMEESDTKWKWI
jgi:hypothetical protein